MSILETTKVEELIKHSTKPLVYVENTATVEQAFKCLTENNILGAPIFDKKQNKYVGLVDMIDILTFLVKVFHEAEHRSMSIQKLVSLSEHFKKLNVETISDLSRRNPWVPVKAGSSLKSVVEILAYQHVHRVPILGDDGKVVNIITQSDIVAFISAHLDKFGSELDKSIGDLGLGSSPVVQIPIESTVIQAFDLIVENRISAVAVVDASHHLIATISVRDLRGVTLDTNIMERMHSPLRLFLEALIDPKIDATNPAISCTSKDSYKTVIIKLVATRVHRIFVINEGRQPVAVVSLSDLLSVLVK